VRLGFRRRVGHPFYPALKPAPAAETRRHEAALCGDFDELWSAASAGARAGRAVFPLRQASDPFLSERERDALWDLFEVPVYSLLIDRKGAVIACECEAQNGLHIRDPRGGGLPFGRLETSLCECGRPGPRLMPCESTEAIAEPEEAESLAG
jgi:hypothetical protein